MSHVRSLWRRVSQDWPRWAQVIGLCLGFEQVGAWGLFHREPNLGIIGFAGALIMFQRAASAQQSRRDHRDGDS